MDEIESKFWITIWKMVIIGILNVIWAITGYCSLDRYFQGHTVITFPATVNSSK